MRKMFQQSDSENRSHIFGEIPFFYSEKLSSLLNANNSQMINAINPLKPQLLRRSLYSYEHIKFELSISSKGKKCFFKLLTPTVIPGQGWANRTMTPRLVNSPRQGGCSHQVWQH
jgi:hypothetical protein